MIYKWSIDYYNQHNGNAPDIGVETFRWVSNQQILPGDINTYPDVNERDEFLAYFNGWQSDLMTVGMGAGSNSASINLEEEEVSGESQSIGVSMEAGLSIGGVGFSFSVGYKESWAYEISIGRSVSYEGSVADITPDLYADNQYWWGMFVYNFSRQRDLNCVGGGFPPKVCPRIAYQVINYWVE